MKTLGFHHAALKVRDVERVAGFYRDVLGLNEIQRWFRDDGGLRSIWLSPMPASDSSGGFLAVELAAPDEPHSALGFSMIALKIAAEQRASICDELRAREIVIVRETRWTVYVRDPEGNLVGLSHHPFEAPPPV